MLTVDELAAVVALLLAPDCGDAQGSDRGWYRHRYHGSPPCAACRDAHNERQRAAYEAVHGPRKPLQPCGTDAAYYRHLTRRELACEPCLRAHADAEAERSARRRGVVVAA